MSTLSEGTLILVVDDDPGVQDVLGMYLRKSGFEVAAAGDGYQAVAAVREQRPALVLLDVMLPGIDGYEVCRRLRAISDVPVIFVTCRDEDVDAIVGLELGADDYVTKPFSPREVVARVRAVLRRAEADEKPAAGQVTVAGIALDRATREARAAGQLLKLTPKEFDILAHLAAHPRIVFSREQIMQDVWGDDFAYQDVRTVDTHVKRLRRKIAEAGCETCTIEAVWGTGYRFVGLADQG